jgi:TolA-binding protein
MKLILYWILLGLAYLAAFSACKNPKKELQEEIKKLEASVAENPIDSNLRKLLVYYQRFAEEHKTDPQAPLYLYKGAEWYFRVGNVAESSRLLELIIQKFGPNEARAEAILLAASLYEERMNLNDRAKELYELYLKEFPKGRGAERAQLFFRPLNERTAYHIERLRDSLYDKNERGKINLPNAFLLMQYYKDFSDRFPDDAKAPAYTYEGGALAKNMGEFGLAVYLFKTFLDRYPTNAQHPEALFALATTLENEMPRYRQTHAQQEQRRQQLDANYQKKILEIQDDLKEAERLYKLFLQQYPQHPLASVVKACLQNIGKDPNDLAAEFAKKHKQQKANQ